MLYFFSILLIVFIVFFLVLYKRKYLFNTSKKTNLYLKKRFHKENKTIISSTRKNNFYYENNSEKYSKFDQKSLREQMYKLYQGEREDKLKALKIAEKLRDKSTLPIIKRGLKDMDPEIVELSAILIRKFK